MPRFDAQCTDNPPPTPAAEAPSGPILRSVEVCKRGGYHMTVAKREGAQPLHPARATRFGWPVREFIWPGKADGTPTLGERKAVAWKCGSRRHVGSECAELAGRILFTRIRDCLHRLPQDELLMMVLTLPRREWTSSDDAYRALYSMWRLLMKMLTRRWGDWVPVIDKKTGEQKWSKRRRVLGEVLLFGPDGEPLLQTRGRYAGQPRTEIVKDFVPLWKRARPKTLTVVEKHRSGFPHLNVIMQCKQLALDLGPHAVKQVETPNGRVERRRVPTTVKGARTLRELKQLARRCKFGWALSASPVESVDAVAGYMVKTAKPSGLTDQEGADILSATPVVGELAKSSQVPVNAPLHFRAVRSTPGWLPPMWTESEYEAEMHFDPLPKAQPETWIDREVRKLVRSRSYGLVARASLACAVQLQLFTAANDSPRQLELFTAA